MNRPFEVGEMLSGSNVKSLASWLNKNCNHSLQLTDEYSVGDLISDLEEIVDGMWHDGIDAMGEDA